MSRNTLLAFVKPAPRGYDALERCYKKTLRLLNKLPKDAPYRLNTEAIICHRLAVVNEAGDDIREIEDNICCGKIELLISQAENEYFLVQKMMTWKPWECVAEPAPPGQWDWPPVQM